jgi:hypothetical protein
MGDLRFVLHTAAASEPKAPSETTEGVQRSAHRGAGIRSREAALKAIGKDLIKKLQHLADSGEDE